MSIDTLLQAAKFVDVDTGEEIDAAKATMDRSSTCSSDAQVEAAVDGSTLITATSQEDSSRGRRSNRVVGAGVTREVHNKLEKNRRAHLKVCFESLRRQLPGLEDKKASNLSILKSAIVCIEQLKRKDREFELEANQLRRQKRMKQEQLRLLKNEIGQDFSNDVLRQSQSTEQSNASAEGQVEGETVETTLQSSASDLQLPFGSSTATPSAMPATVYVPVQPTFFVMSPSVSGTKWHSHVGPRAGMSSVAFDQQASAGLLSKQ